ncbi:F-box only protein 3 isoform X1 [Lingula anatina]|uniref:F-box only protein 3 isoform X1 n=1 Tax=Lingula anatina TaxID=7574 RepID=A0A1S3HCA4_LINAN|nr:F-box only protein 3 isoform X1 [Lingula anatina]|eukprot:XP_013383630.1 F-box only protein 3 isoform X1 [Lingula anatina]
MAAPVNLNNIPDDPLNHIFSYLDYKDLVSCCRACHRLHAVAENNVHWKRLCQFYWLETNSISVSDWKQHFVAWYKDYGRYVNCYRKIKKAWTNIENFIEKSCPKIYSSIQSGVSEEVLTEAENRIHQNLPDAFRCSYRIHNGQSLITHGLMGTVKIASHVRTQELLDLRTATNNYQDHGDLKFMMPITLCPFTHVAQLLVLSEDSGLGYGQVVYPTPDNMLLSNNSAMDFFISGNSFEDWFISYAQDLERNTFSVVNGQIYRLYREPSCIAVTSGIQVTVATAFMPELSTINPPHFFFVYYITMSMAEDEDPKESCQLETRHWIITNEEGNEERVDGPGVVGHYPIMRPGSSFSWTSSTSFGTTYGNMKGYFRMRNLKTGLNMEVECPVFHMKCLPYITCAQAHQQATEVKKGK